MNEVAVAKKMVPEILKELGPTFVELEKPICDAIVQYGCRNQLAIRDIAVKAVPEFANVSEQFFSKMWGVIEEQNNNDRKNLETLMTAILKAESLDITAQVEECKKVQEDAYKREQQRMKNGKKIVQTVVKGVEIVGGAVLVGILRTCINGMYEDYQKTKRTQIRQQQMTERTKIVAGTVRDISIPYNLRNMLSNK